MTHSPDLPSLELSVQQARWLRGARSRLLRRAGIEHRHHIVEIGAGWGVVAGELSRRTGRRVVAVDIRPRPEGIALDGNVDWLVGRAEALPLADASVDLLFAQFTFLWLNASQAVQEAVRVLAPGGMLAVIEPDYGGMMEYPPEAATKGLWISALKRCGADPCVGRKLPVLFAEAGLRAETRFLDRYESPQPSRFDFLTELGLLEHEQVELDRVRRWLEAHPDTGVAHLPLWLALGEKPRSGSV